MRKTIFSIVTLGVIVLLLGPAVVGLMLQKNYLHLISLYNTQKNIHTKILDYQRGWWSSDIALEIVIDPQLLSAYLPISADTAIPKWVVRQHVQHGPVIYHQKKDFPSMLGLAASENKIINSQEAEAFLKLFNLSYTDIRSISFISLFANYFNHLVISELAVDDPGSDTQMGFGSIAAQFWLYPRQQRISGHFEFDQFRLKEGNDVLSVPQVNIDLDKSLSHHSIWLGSDVVDVAEILLQEIGEKDVRITGINIAGYSKAKNDLFNAERTVTIKKMQFEDQAIGPFAMHLSAQNFGLQAIHDVITTYRDIAHNGEVYQGQLRQKIFLILPKMINSATSIKIDKFILTAPHGNFMLNAVVKWPGAGAIEPANFFGLLLSTQANLNIRLSKKLLPDVVKFIAALPDAIHHVAQPDRELLIDSRNQMEFAAQRNLAFIDFLADNGYINNETEDELLAMQKNWVPLDDYSQKVKNLLWQGQISLVVSYQLCWQYGQVLAPYHFLEQRVMEYQEMAEQQMKAQFNSFLQRGYIKEDSENYIANIKWSERTLTSNGLVVE